MEAKLVWGTVMLHSSVLSNAHSRRQLGAENWSNKVSRLQHWGFLNGRWTYWVMRGTFWKSGHQDQSGSVHNEFTESHAFWGVWKTDLKHTKVNGNQALGNTPSYVSESIHLLSRTFSWRVLHWWWLCARYLLPQSLSRNHIV